LCRMSWNIFQYKTVFIIIWISIVNSRRQYNGF
jgi:hypothetical protein